MPKMTDKKSYWKTYRRIRSNVQEHLFAIYGSTSSDGVTRDENMTATCSDNVQENQEALLNEHNDIATMDNQCSAIDTSGITNAVFKKEESGVNRNKHSTRILNTGSWEGARSHLKKSEMTSGVKSETEESQSVLKRQSKARKRFISESSDEENFDQMTLDNSLSLYPSPRCKLERMSKSPEKVARLQVLPGSPQPSTSETATPSRQRKQSEARDDKILNELEKLHEMMCENTRLVKMILTKITAAEINEETKLHENTELPENIRLPVRTTQEMDTLEEYIEVQQSASAMVKYLTTFGGKNVRDSVSRIMEAVITTDLARQYNFSGQKGKLPFGSLKISSIIYRSLQRNPATQNALKIDFEDAVRKWLAGARNCEGGRIKRSKTITQTT